MVLALKYVHKCGGRWRHTAFQQPLVNGLAVGFPFDSQRFLVCQIAVFVISEMKVTGSINSCIQV